MTNKPEPNTRAGEALKPCPLCSGRARLVTFKKRIGRVCPHTVFRQHAVCTKCGAQTKQFKSEGRASKAWNTRPLPQPSDMVPSDVAESWKAKAENYQIERAELLADISDMMANHVENWPSPQKLKTAVALIDKTFHAQSVQLAKLQADGEKLAGALEQLIKHTTWLESVAPPMCIDGKYMGESLSLADACQALTEWKDRA